jgi:drug/metabolite transporter (DMT)-like permease
MGIVVGLLAASLFGSGDFLGGRASRDAPTAIVLFVAQLSAAVGAVALALVFAGAPLGPDLAYGAAAGFANAIGLGLLYEGLSTGRMGIVAPIAAVGGASIPVAWGLLRGEQPGTVVIVGILIAVVAAGLIAREAEERDGASTSRSVVIALFAGVGLGVTLVFYAQTGSDSGLWPIVSGRLAAACVAGIAVVVALVARHEPIRIPSIPRRLAIGAGICDVTATAFMVFGVRHDLTVVVAPLAALGPGFTVMLAWGLLREPISRPQVYGLGLALVGLALIAAG